MNRQEEDDSGQGRGIQLNRGAKTFTRSYAFNPSLALPLERYRVDVDFGTAFDFVRLEAILHQPAIAALNAVRIARRCPQRSGVPMPMARPGGGEL